MFSLVLRLSDDTSHSRLIYVLCLKSAELLTASSLSVVLILVELQQMCWDAGGDDDGSLSLSHSHSHILSPWFPDFC